MKPEPDNTEIGGTATVGTATVGRPVPIDGLVLPGSRLEPAADPGRTAPVSVRIVAVAPHGKLFRYDLEATGWEGGDHDLRAVLVRADGTTTDDLPPLLLRTTSNLPASSPRVCIPPPAPPRQLGGYGQTLFLLGLVWLVGLALLLQLRRRVTPPHTPGLRPSRRPTNWRRSSPRRAQAASTAGRKRPSNASSTKPGESGLASSRPIRGNWSPH